MVIRFMPMKYNLRIDYDNGNYTFYCCWNAGEVIAQREKILSGRDRRYGNQGIVRITFEPFWWNPTPALLRETNEIRERRAT